MPNNRRPALTWSVHALRVVLVAVLLSRLPSPHGAVSSHSDAGEPSSQPPIEMITELTGVTDAVHLHPDKQGLWELCPDGDKHESSVQSGCIRVGRTLPEAANARGYRGPTEALFMMDADQFITGVMILASHDTEEHVALVRADQQFFTQFNGLTWGGVDRAGNAAKIDGVSGATLTSLAMAEGIFARLGRASGSLLFAEPLQEQEIESLDAEDRFIGTDPAGVIRRLDGELRQLAIRTGPFSDDVIGYQGPTELLLTVGPDGRVEKLKIRHSLDNEPYVDYVRQDKWFWSRFEGKTLDELAVWDPVEAGVEGVSGATMTSMAIAETLPLVAQGIRSGGGLERWTEPPASPWSVAAIASFLQTLRLSAGDVATLVLLGLLFLITNRGWMRERRLRVVWLLTVVIVVGWWTGNLISLALITGWASSGVTWRLAIGLVSLGAVALLAPPITRGNPYCNHLCPHGAIQQLVRPRPKSRRHIGLSPRVSRALQWIAPVTLVVVYLTLLLRPATDVSGAEPFHAYLWPVASTASVVLCLASLLVSLCVPMGYCRMGCPTGFLIGYLRRTSASHRITRFDIGLVLLLLFSLITNWQS